MQTTPLPEASAFELPPLPLEEWQATKDTLHLYLQIVGKIRLKLMPPLNHWWHVTLYVTPRGLTTGAIPYKHFTFEIEFDFNEHLLLIKTSTGAQEEIKLQNGLSVSTFYLAVMKSLDVLGIKVELKALPYDNKSKTPFAEDHLHATYNPEQVHNYWRVLTFVDSVMKEFCGRFYGKTCPVQLYWHHIDLTVTRFSGKRIPERPGASEVERKAYSHEVISFGFWPGDEQVTFPAFYSYTFPSPPGIDQEPLAPKAARWVDSNGSPMALLAYEDLRQEEDPRQALLNFLESAYQAGAHLASWPVEELQVQ